MLTNARPRFRPDVFRTKRPAKAGMHRGNLARLSFSPQAMQMQFLVRQNP